MLHTQDSTQACLPLNSTSDLAPWGCSQAPLCLSFHNGQPKTTSRHPHQDYRRVTASGKAPDRPSSALDGAHHTWPLPKPAVSIHPRTGNVHTFPIQCQPYRGLPWSMSSGGQWVGAWEVPRDPRAHATSSPLGLSAPTPRVSQRAFPRDSTREGLPWRWLLGMQWGGRLCEYPCAFCRTRDPPAPGGPWGPVPTWRGRSSATPGAPTAVTVLPHGHQRDRPALLPPTCMSGPNPWAQRATGRRSEAAGSGSRELFIRVQGGFLP